MSAIGDIRDALAGALEAVPGLNPIVRGGQIHPPAAVVELASITYHDASMMEALYTFDVTALVAINDITAARNQLDAYVEPNGIPSALEDAALGDVTVLTVDAYQRFDEEGVSYLGARFTVEVRP